MTLLDNLRNKLKPPVVEIRRVTLDDIAFVLELNEKNVEVLSPMDEAKYFYFIDKSEMFDVIEVDGKLAAFLIALREGIDYGSENYIWFSRQYEKFLYIDRIVIDENFRKIGLGRYLYEYVFQHAEDTGVSVVTAEVDILPVYNEPSFGFHKEMGFEEVGQQIIRGGDVKVSLQARPVSK